MNTRYVLGKNLSQQLRLVSARVKSLCSLVLAASCLALPRSPVLLVHNTLHATCMQCLNVKCVKGVDVASSEALRCTLSRSTLCYANLPIKKKASIKLIMLQIKIYKVIPQQCIDCTLLLQYSVSSGPV